MCSMTQQRQEHTQKILIIMYKAYSQICEHHKDKRMDWNRLQIWNIKQLIILGFWFRFCKSVYINNMILVRTFLEAHNTHTKGHTLDLCFCELISSLLYIILSCFTTNKKNHIKFYVLFMFCLCFVSNFWICIF